MPREVNSNAGSEVHLRAGIYYARLELTLTLLLGFSSEYPLENKGLHGGMSNADDENSAGNIDLGGRCEEIPIGKSSPTHRDSSYE